MRRTLTVLLVLALAPAVVAGCGSDDNDSGDSGSSTTETTSTTASPSVEIKDKAEWITAADAICRKAGEELAAVTPQTQPDAAELERFVNDQLIPNLQSQAQQLRDLPVPEGEHDKIDAIISKLEEGIEELQEDPSAVTGELPAFTEANKLATDYGLKDCGNG
jgi:hypothetical protein